MDILKEVIKGIKPSKAEVKKVNDEVNSFIKKIKGVKLILGGSGAKGTWLKNTFDIDLFAAFNYSKFKDAELSKLLFKELKKKFKVEKLHGSRDYFQVKQDNFTFEIVPVLEIKRAEDAKNITDVSLLHSSWVKKNANEKLKDDVRILKMFCRANGVYGAESYIQGLSGYVLEILVIYYSGFMNLVKAASKWGDRVIVDVEGYYKGKNVFREMNKSKLISPLIIIDPVDRNRNAAAALSFEKFSKFRKICWEFLKKPNKSFFEEKEIRISDLKKKVRGKKLVLLNVKNFKGKVDVAGCKLIGVLEHLAKHLRLNGFKVFSYSWKWDKKTKALFWFYVDKKELGEHEVKQGPPLKTKEHVKRFKKAHKGSFEHNGRIYAKVKRKFVKVEDLFKALIKEKWIKEKVKKVEIKEVFE